EVAVELGVAIVDRSPVGGKELGARDLARVHEAPRLLGRQAKRVDHYFAPPGGTLKKSPSRSGALASASSTGRHGRGSSSSQTLTTSRGCEVGGTSERSSSETFETASRMSLSCPSSRSTSSSRSSRRARCATCRSCSRSIAISFDPPKKKGPLAGALSTLVRRGSLDRYDVGRLRALVALNDFELHPLAFGQRLVAVPCDRREVDEDVVAALALDEAVALLVREPLYGALSQHFLLAEKRRPGHRAADLC